MFTRPDQVGRAENWEAERLPLQSTLEQFIDTSDWLGRDDQGLCDKKKKSD